MRASPCNLFQSTNRILATKSCIKNYNKMEPSSIERLVYDGSDPSDDWIITHIGHKKLDMGRIRTIEIESIDDYESECKIHQRTDRCMGHIGQTKHGVYLPSQSLAIHNHTISNDIYSAAAIALVADTKYNRDEYRRRLLNSMKRKTGRMRKGILNCHVDGSLRMVISPQYDYAENVVCVPKYLKGIWVVTRYVKEEGRYREIAVKDKDSAIAVRPPSLSAKSVQPIVLEFWDSTCLGINPELLKSFEGDYDGDEMHLFPVYSDDAIEECRHWVNTPNPTMLKAKKIFKESNMPHKDESPGGWMVHTTMSWNEIKDRYPQPLMAEQARTRSEHLGGMADRYENREMTSITFVDESIRGMEDINRQQLSQPIVGDMSRIARIAASNVVQSTNGMFGVYSSAGFVPVHSTDMDEGAGNAAVRGISTLCASAQQVALNSHRADKEDIQLHDLIRDLVVGSELTLIVTQELSDIEFYRNVFDAKWIVNQNDHCYILLPPQNFKPLPSLEIKATWNPTILSSIKDDERVWICCRGISLICCYYTIPFSRHEIISLGILYTFRVENSKSPISTRDGIEARDLHWIETTMATHYSGMRKRLSKGTFEPQPAATVSACLMASNFREVEQ